MTRSSFPEGNAIAYCEGAFQTTSGKTAHDLVRFTERYNVMAVIDSACSGCDTGELLDGARNDIPVVASLEEALDHARRNRFPATHFVVGIAPHGGRITVAIQHAIIDAIRKGLNVDSGLNDFISDDQVMTCVASGGKTRLRDVRKPPSRDQLHTFTGKIEEVTSTRIALLGTDSMIGKRTTAWKLIHGLDAAGKSAEMIGTGPTAWMQGANFSTVLGSLVGEFVAGELEHACWSAWNDCHPDFLVIEGQDPLLNPVYPGSHEIIEATRPHAVILQHAPARAEYNGFPGHAVDPLDFQIRAIELFCNRPVIAITINHEGLKPDEVIHVCSWIEQETGLPTVDVLRDGTNRLVEAVLTHCDEQSAACSCARQ